MAIANNTQFQNMPDQLYNVTERNHLGEIRVLGRNVTFLRATELVNKKPFNREMVANGTR